MAESQLAQARVLPLFPTFVWYAQLAEAEREPINAQLRHRLDQMTPDPGVNRAQQLLQTNQRLHEDPALAGLLPFIDGAVKGALDFLKVKYQRFRITGCWANLAGPGLSHKMHCHPNNFFSGVYYVDAGPGGDHITFHDPRPQPNVLMPPTRELTNDNAGKVTIGVKPGTLVLFPGWLNHSVDPNQSPGQRISVAFNIMFDDFAQTMSPPMWEGNLK
ncbi:MAG: 2OG-Fe(II) oxygenase family protein [Pseudomonadota bacterium]